MGPDELVVVVVMVTGVLLILPPFMYTLYLRSRSMRIEEKKLAMQERLKADELNARILQMDDLGISAAEMAAMRDEIRQLREEINELKQQRLV